MERSESAISQDFRIWIRKICGFAYDPHLDSQDPQIRRTFVFGSAPRDFMMSLRH